MARGTGNAQPRRERHRLTTYVRDAARRGHPPEISSAASSPDSRAPFTIPALPECSPAKWRSLRAEAEGAAELRVLSGRGSAQAARLQGPCHECGPSRTRSGRSRLAESSQLASTRVTRALPSSASSSPRGRRAKLGAGRLGPRRVPRWEPEVLGPASSPSVQALGLQKKRPPAGRIHGWLLDKRKPPFIASSSRGKRWRKANAGEKGHRHGHQHPVRFVALAVAGSGSDRAPGDDVGHGRCRDHAVAQLGDKGGGQTVAPASDLHEVGPFGEEGTRRNRRLLPVLVLEKEPVFRVEAVQLQSEVASVSKGQVVLGRDACGPCLDGVSGGKR